jgi:predicted ABC-type exoprotein transport system permease subunit
MKKSGNLSSFFLFGMFSQIVLLVFFALFFGTKEFAINNYIAIFVVATFFLVLRILMDWKKFDNQIEDGFRRIAISEKYEDRLTFALFGSLILAFLNFNLFIVQYARFFLLSLLAMVLMQEITETLRLKYNTFMLKKSLQTKQTFLRTNNKEEQLHG